MSNRITISVEIELLSDSIFGSGHSIPGGEDISVTVDNKGFPYLKSTTFKGLLRESLTNWLAWTKGNEQILDQSLEQILGIEGRSSQYNDRRIMLSQFEMKNKPQDCNECFVSRAFTCIENGVSKDGSLRNALCIKQGSVFVGEIECKESDYELIEKVLKSIKWIGSLRNRGFGSVKISTKLVEAKRKEEVALSEGNVLRYRLRNLTPIVITNLQNSFGNALETRSYIPGTAVRGMVIGKLANIEKDFFEKNKVELLSEKTKFLDAIPNPKELAAMPSIKGFYEDKVGNDFKNFIVEDYQEGLKRAKLGEFCAIENNVIKYWSANLNGSLRINKNKKDEDNEKENKIFQTRHLLENQVFEGYIVCENLDILKEIAKIFQENMWIGADKYAGYGKCVAEKVEIIKDIPLHNAFKIEDTNDICMVATSPFTMVDEFGVPCGINEEELAMLLGVNKIESINSNTSVAEYGGYNSTWGCREPAVRMYQQGSLFRIKTSEDIKKENILKLQRLGLGIRKAEGFGQVVFMSPDDLKVSKEQLEINDVDKANTVAENRRKRYEIIEKYAELITDRLSNSATGVIQTYCEDAKRKAKANEANPLKDLFDYLYQNTENRTSTFSGNYKDIDIFIKGVVNEKMTNKEIYLQLDLICEAFDFNRRSGVRK